MRTSPLLRRAAVAAAGAALLVLGAASADAGGPQPGTEQGRSVAPRPALVTPATAAGSELRFVAVAPCRIIDTRVAGGRLPAASRTFDTTATSYAAQGGKAGSCDVSAVATAVQLNLRAISQSGSTSDLKGWATGTTEPTASLVNYNPSVAVANMVTVPVDTSGRLTLRTPGSAHVFADVAGYWVKPLYVSVDATTAPPTVHAGASSGFVGVVKDGTGSYRVTFDRNVSRCAPAATDYLFGAVHEISVDGDFSHDSTVYVSVKNSATGVAEDTIFHLVLTC